ncbi:kinase-like domain-containing protein [Gaertneriomyces semiglobifer]|nr:kinase-like domain-containing protein [Gaertneriomyces semiglobifer]
MLGPQNSNRGYRKIEPPVGEGSFGKVYKCKALDGTLYAWKEVRISHKSEGAALMREVSALRALQHPNIVRLLDSWIEANKLILILELCDEDLADRIEAGPLEQRLILEYAVQVLLALEFMHSHNYIHRDIKPENVLLKNGQVKLADFGIARLIEGMPAKTYAGTPCFMAPEVSRGSYDSKADMFSFGTMLYQCISGEYMFNDEPKNFQSVRPYNAYVITALSKLSPKLDARLVQTLHRTLPWNVSIPDV